MNKKVDLNSDLGESFGAYKIGNDENVIPLITSANVACGWHAGDSLVMQKTVSLCKGAGIAVGTSRIPRSDGIRQTRAVRYACGDEVVYYVSGGGASGVSACRWHDASACKAARRNVQCCGKGYKAVARDLRGELLFAVDA